jgi:ribosomal protein S18 acetylase RimI-like enzyme
MVPDLQIRNALPTDVDALTTVFVECFNAAPWNDGWGVDAARERLQAILGAPHFRGAVAVSNGAVVGLLLGQKERWIDAYHYNLQEMCILPRYQRQGIGRDLLRYLLHELRQEGTEKVYLITAPDSGAAAFYSAQGFYVSRGRVVMACAQILDE